MRTLSLSIAVLFFCAGCSDDGGPGPTGDGPVVQTDGATHDGPGHDGPGATDKGPLQPDINVPPGCVKECVEFYDFLCVKDPASGNCEACLNDSHCKNNPRSDGPICDTANQMCVCNQTSDCASATTGLKCLMVGNYKMCTCDTDTDCPAPYTICDGTLIKRCVKRCTTDSNCTKGGFTGTCDTGTGKCSYPDF